MGRLELPCIAILAMGLSAEHVEDPPGFIPGCAHGHQLPAIQARHLDRLALGDEGASGRAAVSHLAVRAK